ncbi:hypothetical protein JNB88_13345 [Rhizobium cauense]|uniref:hypothetical protein n=1 Tax=Rhizobium cauense TaxID=1166683 RepID=UPI001C6E5CE3|nr:hypothetical protein [Rhizobium cauense]MBW9114631.1 hypothetical protein [Rhizobium cauense]
MQDYPMRTDNHRILTVSGHSFIDTAVAIEEQGLVRDPDRGSVEVDASGRPSFASWSGGEGDDLEIDFHSKDNVSWLALRGERVAGVAETLASRLGAIDVGSVEDAFVAAMERPRRSGTSTRGNSSGWHILQTAVACYSDANSTLVRSLIRAGLSDPDWRVRMTAMLAIGRLGLADLAPLAMKAEVPQVGRKAVSQQDRRLLMALRQAAHDVGLGLPPSSGPGDGKDEAVAALRRSFQAELHYLLSGDPRGNHSVAAPLVAKLMSGHAQE